MPTTTASASVAESARSLSADRFAQYLDSNSAHSWSVVEKATADQVVAVQSQDLNGMLRGANKSREYILATTWLFVIAEVRAYAVKGYEPEKAARKHAQREVTMRGRRIGSRSTSPIANLMDDAMLEVWSTVLDWMIDYDYGV
jgi:hypothetical protein